MLAYICTYLQLPSMPIIISVAINFTIYTVSVWMNVINFVYSSYVYTCDQYESKKDSCNVSCQLIIIICALKIL